MGPPTYIPQNRVARPLTDMTHQLSHQMQAPLPLLSSSPLPSSDLSTKSHNDNSFSHSQPIPSPQPPPSASAIITSLREATGLYQLSNEALEYAVAHVVREEGFVQLVRTLFCLGLPLKLGAEPVLRLVQMERLSGMWRIHSLAGLSIQ